jgi:hypothetical protein
MAVRARPASDAQRKTAERLAAAVGLAVPGESQAARNNRLDGAGAVAGIAIGALVGVAGGLMHSAVWRTPLVLEAVALGAMAMAVTDGGMTALAVADPRSWTVADWLSDAVPHLAFGLAAAATLRAVGRNPVSGLGAS